jgi:hypothetical protein
VEVIAMHFDRDEDGRARAHAEPPCEVLGWFLEQDVQADEIYCRELITTIEEIEIGIGERWEDVGNAHRLTLSPTGAEIESEYAEPTARCELTLTELRDVLTAWLAHVRGGNRNPDESAADVR